jgi:hypothetical protein
MISSKSQSVDGDIASSQDAQLWLSEYDCNPIATAVECMWKSDSAIKSAI